MENWRDELEAVVKRARDESGDDDVRAALAELVESLESAPDTSAPSVPVLGIAPCSTGWVAVLIRPTGHTSLHGGSTVVGIVEQVREQEGLDAVAFSSATGALPEIGAWRTMHPSVEVLEVEPVVDLGGLTIPPMYSGMGFTEADLRAACAVACAAVERL